LASGEVCSGTSARRFCRGEGVQGEVRCLEARSRFVVAIASAGRGCQVSEAVQVQGAVSGRGGSGGGGRFEKYYGTGDGGVILLIGIDCLVQAVTMSKVPMALMSALFRT